MTLNLTGELESALVERARQSGTTPERYLEQIVKQHVREGDVQPPDSEASIEEKLQRLRAIGRHCGVALSNDQLSREYIYD